MTIHYLTSHQERVVRAARLWVAAAEKHQLRPELRLEEVLTPEELRALEIATREAEAI